MATSWKANFEGDINLLVPSLFQTRNSNNFSRFKNESVRDDGHIVDNQIIAIDSKEIH
jgi:hypothetical protein